MKKRLVLFIVALCLVLSLVCAMAACGDKDKGNTTDKVEQGNQTTDNGTTDHNGTTDNNGTTTDNGTTDNNGGQSGTGSTTVLTKTMATRESILAVIGDTYKVTAKSAYDDSSTTVAADGTYYYTTAPYEAFYKKVGNNGNGTYLYAYGNKWDGAYHKMGTPTFTADGLAPTMLGRGHVYDMLQFAGETLNYNTEETVTFLGRAAKKYTFESENAYGYDVLFHEEVTIDDATGACLKYEGYGRAGAGFTGATRNKTSFEVTELSYGAGNTAARTLLDSYIAKIDVCDWDTDYITAVGLGAFSAPNGELWLSEWEDSGHCSRDSEEPDWTVQYNLFSDTQAEYQDYIRQYFLSIYNAGAKLDYNGQEESFDELYSPNGGWDDVNLTAYVVGNATYKVYASANYTKVVKLNEHVSGWRITIQICKDE